MYPTASPVHDPTAVMGKRFGAWIIDALIGLVLVTILMFSFATRHSYGTASTARRVCDDINNDTSSSYFCAPADTEVFIWKGTDLALTGLVGLGYWFLNDAVLTGLTGFSIGKGLVGIRVVRRDGRICGLARSTLRWLLWVADGAPYCVPLVGLILAPTSKGHRRVGDMAAGTFVVGRQAVGVPPAVPGVTVPDVATAAAWGAPGPLPWGHAPGGWAPPAAAPAPPTWGTPTAPPPAAPPAWGTPTAPPAAAPPAWGAPAAPPSVPPVAPPPSGSGPMWAPPPAPEPTPTPAPEPTTWPPPVPGAGDPTVVQPVVGPPTEPVAAVGPAASQPGVGAPLWDDARDTYIQWDPDIARWVQWDERARRWDPI